MNGHSVRIGLVQSPPVYLNLGESIKRFEQTVADCAADGAEIIVFPETWLPGYPIWLDDAPNAGLWDYPPAKRLYRYLFENSVSIPGPEFEVILEAARQTGSYIVIGVNERDGGTIYNTTIYAAPAGEYKTHRKLTPTYTERLVWGVGDGSTLETINSPFGTIGGLICWEHWLPLARAAMHAKHEAIHTAQFPTVHERHQIASRHYAFEGQCFVLASGCVLTKQNALDGFKSLNTEDTEVYALLESMRNDQLQRGGSAVIAPDISYIAEPVFDDPSTLFAELDLSLLRQGNLLLDTDGHYSRPDVFELRVNDRKNANVRFASEKD
ncbi:MAG: carbon-nitrogen hydrolase family protein [Acidobacteriota bacterium]|nr:carbon-nitrogen hydrolase family protein [Acidobacteriota bacterium]